MTFIILRYVPLHCICLALLYTNNEASEKEIRKTIPFTIASKRIKYVGINILKKMKDLYSKNYKTLIKDIENDTNWCDVHFLETFYHKWISNFIKSFSPSIEMIIWFLFFILLIWCIALIDLRILKNPCVPGINPIWSWCMILNVLLDSVY